MASRTRSPSVSGVRSRHASVEETFARSMPGSYLSRSLANRRSLRERRSRPEYGISHPDFAANLLSRARSSSALAGLGTAGTSLSSNADTPEYRARRDLIRSLDDEIMARRKRTRELKTQALIEGTRSRPTADLPLPLRSAAGRSRSRSSRPGSYGEEDSGTLLRKSYDDLSKNTVSRYLNERAYANSNRPAGRKTSLVRRYSFK